MSIQNKKPTVVDVDEHDDDEDEKQPAESTEAETGEIEILEEPERSDDDDDDSEPEAQRSEKRPRAERRRERGRLLERLDENARALVEMRERVARAEGALSARPQIREPDADPLADELKKNRQRQDQHATLFEHTGAKMSPEQVQEWRARGRELLDEEASLQYRINHKKHNPPQNTAAMERMRAIHTQLTVRYPDIVGNAAAEKLMVGVVDARVAGGAKRDWDTFDAAVIEVRRLMGIRPPGSTKTPTPDDAARSRMSGTPRSGSAGGAKAPLWRGTTNDLTKLQKADADDMFRSIRDVEQRRRRYIKEVLAPTLRDGAKKSA
jgi:hypothetical protein